jgi:predicted RNase H-like HicB family nuclease
MKREFLVVYEFACGSYSGHAPDLPDCTSTGGTHEEMRENMRTAVEIQVSSLVEQGKEVPSQVTSIIHFKKPVEEAYVQHWIVERMEIEVPVLSAG